MRGVDLNVVGGVSVAIDAISDGGVGLADKIHVGAERRRWKAKPP